MKKPIKVCMYGLLLGLAFLCQGCNEDTKAAFWWLPDAWMPVQFSQTVDSTTGGSGDASGGATGQ